MSKSYHWIEVGDRLVDREDDSEVVVVDRRGAASDVHIDELDQTVAEANPDHPDDATVVDVAYREQLEAAGIRWQQPGFPDRLKRAVVLAGIETYSFPITRLRLPDDDKEATDE